MPPLTRSGSGGDRLFYGRLPRLVGAGQGEPECSAALRVARYPVVDPDPAAVARNKHLRDVEPEPFPAPGIRAPREAGEEEGFLPVRHARPRVLDRDLDRPIALLDPDGDLDAGLPELLRVADEVRKDLREEIVGHDPDGSSLVDDPGIGMVRDPGPDDGVEVDGSRHGLAGDEAPERRDVLDDLDAPADSVPEFQDHLPLLPLQHLGEQVGVAESDGVGVVDVMHHDVEVEVCLFVGCPQFPFHPDTVGDIRA